MDYLFAFLGFVALIVLHEGGHFAAAKAVGMRVERFALFFPPLIVKVRRGETEYGIGAIPLGGYVKITGMSPAEEIPPEVAHRAYYNQPVWKRIVVILAGPVVNIVIAIVLVWVLLMTSNLFGSVNTRVGTVTQGSPAASVLRPGDEILAANGARGSTAIRKAIADDRCADDAKVRGCRGASAIHLLVRRHGTVTRLSIRPEYTTIAGESGMFIGIDFGISHDGFWTAGSRSVSGLWHVTTETVGVVVRVFAPKERKQLNSVVGAYDYTANSFNVGPAYALQVIALISLSLGIINLFPFLPLDGGHIFWAIAEKVRGKRIPFVVMERAGIIGFALILIVFAIGLSNDVHGLSNGTFKVH